MIRTQRAGITFEYVLPFKFEYWHRAVVRVRDYSIQAGVRITYADGTKRFITTVKK